MTDLEMGPILLQALCMTFSKIPNSTLKSSTHHNTKDFFKVNFYQLPPRES